MVRRSTTVDLAYNRQVGTSDIHTLYAIYVIHETIPEAEIWPYRLSMLSCATPHTPKLFRIHKIKHKYTHALISSMTSHWPVSAHVASWCAKGNHNNRGFCAKKKHDINRDYEPRRWKSLQDTDPCIH